MNIKKLLGYETYRINGKEIKFSSIMKDKVIAILKNLPRKDLRNIDSIDVCLSKKNANLFLMLPNLYSHNYKKHLLGSYNPESKAIFIYRNPKCNWIETLLHEIGHAIYRNTRFQNSEVMAEKYAKKILNVLGLFSPNGHA